MSADYPAEWFRTGVTRTEPYTLQEAFDRIWQFFIVERHPRSVSAHSCRYRTNDSACAVGCLLPDSVVNLGNNGNKFEILRDRNDLVKVLFPDEIVEDIFCLQGIHDNTRWTVDELEALLRKFSESKQLSIPSIPLPV